MTKKVNSKKLKSKKTSAKKIALIVSQYNSDITDALFHGAFNHLLQAGFLEKNITIIHVPGAVEISLIAQALAKSQQYLAIIALGCVIQGDTDHYDYVCEQVSNGCQRVMLDYHLPVIFGVLTTQNQQQAKERVGGKHGHKGIEAASAALTMIDLMKQLS